MFRKILFQCAKKELLKVGFFATACPVSFVLLYNDACRRASNGDLPPDVRDQMFFDGKGRCVTYGYTATGYPVYFPMSEKSRNELETKWAKEKADTLEREHLQETWKQFLKNRK